MSSSTSCRFALQRLTKRHRDCIRLEKGMIMHDILQSDIFYTIIIEVFGTSSEVVVVVGHCSCSLRVDS